MTAVQAKPPERCGHRADKRLPPCPHCRASTVIRYGKNRGRQRYRCRACGRTFNAFTGTFLARLRHKRERILFERQEMPRSTPLRQSAARLGISVATAFRWRHAVLAAWSRQIPVPPQPKGDVVAVVLSYRDVTSPRSWLRAWKNMDLALARLLPTGEATQRAALGQETSFLLACWQDGRGVKRLGQMLGPEGTNRWLRVLGRTLAPGQRLLMKCGPSHLVIERCWRAGDPQVTHLHVHVTQPGSTPLGHGHDHLELIALFRRWLRRFVHVSARYFSSYLLWFTRDRAVAELARWRQRWPVAQHDTPGSAGDRNGQTGAEALGGSILGKLSEEGREMDAQQCVTS